MIKVSKIKLCRHSELDGKHGMIGASRAFGTFTCLLLATGGWPFGKRDCRTRNDVVAWVFLGISSRSREILSPHHVILN